MERMFKDCLCKNFAAAIEMLKGVINICPDEIWKTDKKNILYGIPHYNIFRLLYDLP
ncbi:MAG: hypothetical protein HC892_09800, partial [Saprospiraceae bacterium]|nr:hypothetical protein [Saprospiraceae bacterium]